LASDAYDVTALIYAANKHPSYFNSSNYKLLLENGALVNDFTKEGVTALHTAAAWGSARAVKILIERGARIMARDSKGRTPLHYLAASSKYNKKCLKLFLDAGVDVNRLDSEGMGALDYCRDGEATNLLRKSGAIEH
jgi:ankyrin repeat protein